MSVTKQKFKHFKLGVKASVFYDPASGLKVVKEKGGKVLVSKLAKSKRLKQAQASGHIIAIDETEYNKMNNNYAEELAEIKEAKKEALEKGEKYFAEKKKKEQPKEEETTEEEETEEEGDDESWKDMKNADDLKAWAKENLELTEEDITELDELDKAKKVKAFIESKKA